MDVLNKITKQEAKDLATTFFYWWHNQPGTNTEMAFDEWYDLIKEDN